MICRIWVHLLFLLAYFAEPCLFFSERRGYVENRERSVTVPVKFTNEQFKSIERRMMNVLGIRRPQLTKQPDQFLSRYMKALYRFWERQKSEFDTLLNNEIRTASAEDSSSSVSAEAEEDYGFESLFTSDVRIDAVVGFTAKSIVGDSDIFGSEFAEINFGTARDNIMEDDTLGLVRAEVYLAVRNDTIELSSLYLFVNHGEDLVPITTQMAPVHLNDTDMMAFDITHIFNGWIQYPDVQRVLYMRVIDFDGNTLLPEQWLINEIHTFGIGFFAEDNSSERVAARERRKRAVDVESNDVNDNPYAKAQPSVPHVIAASQNEDASCKCHLETLYINFKDINWHMFAVAPAGFNVNYCLGSCNLTEMNVKNATHHAYIQDLARVQNKGGVEAVKCAPVHMDSFSFLFQSDDQTMVKRYADIVVTDCGCV